MARLSGLSPVGSGGQQAEGESTASKARNQRGSVQKQFSSKFGEDGGPSTPAGLISGDLIPVRSLWTVPW